jgi:hypothetical protein
MLVGIRLPTWLRVRLGDTSEILASLIAPSMG